MSTERIGNYSPHHRVTADMIRHRWTAIGFHIQTADSTRPESHSASTKTKLETTRKQNKMGEYKETKIMGEHKKTKENGTAKRN
jgi:hypothetical protein